MKRKNNGFRPAKTAASAAFLLPAAALAAGGTSNINTLFETILSTMQGVAVVLATIAFVYAGFRMLFQRASIEQVAGPLIGGVVIGAAAWIANLLVG
ncbi:MAG: TrbC/VirB2 family protein [Sutterellaceae bacterium]|nr:TrbC/VirB2 family protein [Sutterellaceae bacterium]MDD7441685.1 TrbC/VirB2 family protein [Sutterellaceae bacterium]MDY2868704.1 TrbC/VirB2 family protein [Mesosutterella sp.]